MEAKNRRAWVKNVAIIFLTVLLLLTFFSNTILNYSLPEVSAQYARYDSIAGAIKASGSVKANESFVVTYDEADEDMAVTNPGQTRKIVSVYVKQGSEVAIGDPILALQGGASKELEEAEKKLRDLEKQYALDQLNDTIAGLTSDKSKSESQNNLTKAYRELAELKELYTVLQAGNDPTDTLKEQKKAAQKEADNIQKQIDEINKKISEAEGKISSAEGNIQEDYTSGLTLEERYTAAKQEYDVLKAEYDALTAKVDSLQEQYDEASGLSGDVAKAYEISQQIHTLSETLNETRQKLDYLNEDNEDVLNGNTTIVDEFTNDQVERAIQKVKDAQGALDVFKDSEEYDFYIQQCDKQARLQEIINVAQKAFDDAVALGESDKLKDLLEVLNNAKADYEFAQNTGEYAYIDKYNRLVNELEAATSEYESLKSEFSVVQ